MDNFFAKFLVSMKRLCCLFPYSSAVLLVWIKVEGIREAFNDVYDFPFGNWNPKNSWTRSWYLQRLEYVEWLCASLLWKRVTSIQTSFPLGIQLPRGSYWWVLANLFIRHEKRSDLALPTGTSNGCCWTDVTKFVETLHTLLSFRHKNEETKSFRDVMDSWLINTSRRIEWLNY